MIGAVLLAIDGEWNNPLPLKVLARFVEARLGEELAAGAAAALRGRPVLWVVPNLHELLWAGRHANNPVGALELLLPSIEGGEIPVAGEVPATGHERLVQSRPRLRPALYTARLSPFREEEALRLARGWAALRAPAGAAPVLAEETLREAQLLARQYLADRAAPGGLLHLLNLTWHRITARERGAARGLTVDDLLVTLAQLTGLPRDILDERAASTSSASAGSSRAG